MDTFELIIILIKNLITRFKKECLVIINIIISYMIENESEKKYPRKVFMNMG